MTPLGGRTVLVRKPLDATDPDEPAETPLRVERTNASPEAARWLAV
ncbi:hypothetical protein [Halopelagius longus]|nr:hypothetical protein [Halopelagius longus]